MRLFGTDLVLLHPPSVYDFRDAGAEYGPISDVIFSTPAFEMYPVGLTSIASHLEARGYNVRIVNLAQRMVSEPTYDAERAIASLDPALFGIDLHWLPHAHGALKVAEIVKRHHPQTPVLFGGLSVSEKLSGVAARRRSPLRAALVAGLRRGGPRFARGPPPHHAQAAALPLAAQRRDGNAPLARRGRARARRQRRKAPC